MSRNKYRIERKGAAEHQHFDCGLIEVKLASGDDPAVGEMTFSGYGAVFGNLDSYGDVIQKGAFKDTLREAKKANNWPAMLMQHGGWGMGADDMTPVGIWTSMEEDDIGLKVEGKLADTMRGREAYGLLKMTPRPAITGMSIGYMAKEFILGTKPDEPRRTLKKVDLVEVSLVTFPANGKARVQSVKSIDSLSSITEIEDYLREAGGFSRAEAKGLIARIKSANPREAEADLTQLAAAITRNINILKGA